MKIDRLSLEQESHSKLSHEHVCAKNELPDQLRIFHVDESDGKPRSHFELFSIWVATIEDVQSGDADAIGDILNLSSIKVSFCPFCGVSLKK